MEVDVKELTKALTLEYSGVKCRRIAVINFSACFAVVYPKFQTHVAGFENRLLKSIIAKRYHLLPDSDV